MKKIILIKGPQGTYKTTLANEIKDAKVFELEFAGDIPENELAIALIHNKNVVVVHQGSTNYPLFNKLKKFSKNNNILFYDIST